MRGLTLYRRKTAATERIPVCREQKELCSVPAGRLAVSIVYDLCNAVDIRPVVYNPTGSPIVSVLFPSVCIGCEELSRRYGELAAAVSTVWPLVFSGTAEGDGNACMTFLWTDDRILFERTSVSGRDFDRVEGLCLELTCEEPDCARRLTTVLSHLSPHQDCICESRGHSGFLEAHGLAIPFDGAFFCYVPLDDGELDFSDYIGCLTLDQKAALWETFLDDSYSPLEFDWLTRRLAQGGMRDYLDWEFSLDVAMERMGYRVSNEEAGFGVMDGDGHRRRFDYGRGSCAERMFLKFLFPDALKQ